MLAAVAHHRLATRVQMLATVEQMIVRLAVAAHDGLKEFVVNQPAELESNPRKELKFLEPRKAQKLEDLLRWWAGLLWPYLFKMC